VDGEENLVSSPNSVLVSSKECSTVQDQKDPTRDAVQGVPSSLDQMDPTSKAVQGIPSSMERSLERESEGLISPEGLCLLQILLKVKLIER
jgi:hypothetical protein